MSARKPLYACLSSWQKSIRDKECVYLIKCRPVCEGQRGQERSPLTFNSNGVGPIGKTLQRHYQ